MAGILKRNDYAFIDKRNIIDEIRTAIEDSGEPVEHIAHSARISPCTIYAWLNGKTKSPYTRSLVAVARALGKRLTLVDDELHMAAPPPPAAYGRGNWRNWRRYQ